MKLNKGLSRREFLQVTGGLTLAMVTHSCNKVMAVNVPDIELHAWNAQGEPLEKKQIEQLYFLDLQDEPLPSPPLRAETGKVISQLPLFPFAIALMMTVEGFGRVTLYADNEGKGYDLQDFPLNLNLAFARSRLYRVRQYMAKWRQVEFSPSIAAKLQQAETYLKAAENTRDDASKAEQCNQSLAESLWAGEEVVLAKAEQDILEQGPRPDFLFGCNFGGHPSAGKQYDDYFQQVFNYATIPLYWAGFEPLQGEKNFAQVDAQVDWLRRANITPKGHPLVWLSDLVMPDWTVDKSYTEMKQLIFDHVKEITAHYGAKIPYYDIINEVHNIASQKVRDYSFEQFLELTLIAANASREGYSGVTRIINECCLWSENIADNPPPQYSPYQFFQACLKAEIPFEVIGLQLYYPHRDLFEINRLLERFHNLGKTIHITELGVSSSTEVDPKSYFKKPSGLWHKPWSETIQADWVEQFYTICYSKPYVQAISWWDLADYGNFWPNGGLLRPDMTPKESFYRLSSLIQKWRQ